MEILRTLLEVALVATLSVAGYVAWLALLSGGLRNALRLLGAPDDDDPPGGVA